MTIVNLPTIFLHERDHPRPRDKQSSIDWARSLMGINNWVVIDTETTGLTEKSEIVQIAILSPDNEVLLNSLVKPVRAKQMPAQAFASHGLSMSDLQQAPTLAELASQIEFLTMGKLIVCYNAAFDIRLLRQSFEFNGCRVPPLNASCAMVAYSRYVGEWWNSKNDYKWQRLPGGDHSALGDCRATLALIRKMANAVDVVPANVGDGFLAPRGCLIWLAAAVMLVILAGTGGQHNNSPDANVHESLDELPANVDVNPDKRIISKTRAWNPINLPHNCRATFVTSFKEPDAVSYEFYLAGPPDLIRRIFQGCPSVTISMLGSRNTIIKKYDVNVRKFLLNKDCVIVVKDSINLNGAAYAGMKDWNVHLRVPKAIIGSEHHVPTNQATSQTVDAPSEEAMPAPAIPVFPAPPIAPDLARRPVQTSDTSAADWVDVSDHSSFSSERLGRIEREIFGGARRGPLPVRVHALEDAVYHSTHPELSIEARLKRLELTIFGPH